MDSNTNTLKNVVDSIVPVSTSDFELLVNIVQQKTLKKNEHLLKEGTVCKSLYFLITGLFRMYYVDSNGYEINYRFASANHFFVDFQSFLIQKPSRYYWQAMQDSTLFEFNFEDVQHLYSISAFWNKFGRLMAERVYLQLNERVEMLLFLKPKERYQYLLNNNPDLFNQVSQFHLSSYMGIKPESLSRLRKRISKK